MIRAGGALLVVAAVALLATKRGTPMVLFDVSHNGVTWTLQNEPIAHGTFADGSPWVENSVAVPVVVEIITPGPTTANSPVLGLAGCRVNGSVKNPNQTAFQGFDERKFADNAYNPNAYGLIFDKTKYLAVPIALVAGDSLVSAIHYANPPVFGTVCNGPWIQAMGVLTVVGAGHGLTNGSHFRPYYGGPTKFPPRSAAGCTWYVKTGGLRYLRAADLPSDLIVTRIIGFELLSRRPRYLGKNARRDDHGFGAGDQMIRLVTNAGIEGIGVCRAKKEEVAKLLGKDPFSFTPLQG